MAQVFLDGLDVVPALYRRHGIRMAQVVKANGGSAYLLHNPLETVVYRPIAQKAACGIRKKRPYLIRQLTAVCPDWVGVLKIESGQFPNFCFPD